MAATHYTAELQVRRKSRLVLTIPADSAHDQCQIHVPAADREAGDCTLSVRGITAAGEKVRKSVGPSFVLQIVK